MLSFNQDGLLPPGDYPMTLLDLRNSLLISGPPGSTGWDRNWRSNLVNNLEIMVNQLWEVADATHKIGRIYIDGSFVEDKDHPHDIDGYFECDYRFFTSGDLHRELNKLEPDKIWTWNTASRRPCFGSTKKQLPMWHKYRVELYPHYGQPVGIFDQYGHELQFPSAFRQQRSTFKPKGIIEIIR